MFVLTAGDANNNPYGGAACNFQTPNNLVQPIVASIRITEVGGGFLSLLVCIYLCHHLPLLCTEHSGPMHACGVLHAEDLLRSRHRREPHCLTASLLACRMVKTRSGPRWRDARPGGLGMPKI